MLDLALGGEPMGFHQKMLLAGGIQWVGALVATLHGEPHGALACMAMEALIGILALAL